MTHVITIERHSSQFYTFKTSEPLPKGFNLLETLSGIKGIDDPGSNFRNYVEIIGKPGLDLAVVAVEIADAIARAMSWGLDYERAIPSYGYNPRESSYLGGEEDVEQ